MRDARKCAAKSKRSGRPCDRWSLLVPGPDGLRTKHCRLHGGVQERAERGDPTRPGRPRDSGLYAEHFKRPNDPEFLERARTKVGQLVDEVTLLRRNLDDLLERAAAHPDIAERARLLGFVGEHVDRIARVEERRARTLATLQGLDEPPGVLRIVTGDEPDDPVTTTDARQRLRDKLLRDAD